MNKTTLNKKKGNSAPQQAKQTLRSTVIGRFLDLLSEGPIEGVVGGAKGVRFNDTPLQSSDDTWNFTEVTYEDRAGLPSQDLITGFEATENEVQVGVAVTNANPVIRAITEPTVDAIRITIQLPQGLWSEKGTKEGKVQFRIETRALGSGPWLNARDEEITGTIFGPYERSYRIENPHSGAFEFRTSRLSPPSVSGEQLNDFALARYTEIVDESVTYPNSAIVGMTFDASTMDGGAYPVRRYRVRGLLCRVPTNYDADAKTYTGMWDYSFKYEYTNNPAWCTLELLTNARWGLGQYLSDPDINLGEIYNTAVYCDQLVDYTKKVDGEDVTITEPRFTLNCVLDSPDHPVVWLQRILSVYHANFTSHNAQLVINQDRPASTKAVITQANIVEGSFWEESSGLSDRHTEVNLRFNNKDKDYKVDFIDRSASEAVLEEFNYNPLKMDLFGVTSEGQADREARYLLDTQEHQKAIAHWSMGVEAYHLRAYDVVEVMTPHYSGRQNSGRINSVSGTAITLDRDVTVVPNSKIDIPAADGTVLTRNITSSPGTYNVITVDSPLGAVSEQATFIVKADVYPRLFRITSLKQKSLNLFDIDAVEYDPNKWARIEGGALVETPPTYDPDNSTIGPVDNIVFREGAELTDGSIRRNLSISWTPPTRGTSNGYMLRWRVNKGSYTVIDPLDEPTYTIANIAAGTVEVTVWAYGIGPKGNSIRSVGKDSTYTIDTTSGGGSPFLAPTNLRVLPGGGTQFVGRDLKFEWTNPVGNGSIPAVLRDFQVIIKNPTTSAVVNTLYVPAVEANNTQTYTYTYSQNSSDNGGVPQRSLIVEVRCRDTNNKTSAAATATFTNPAPAVPNNIVAQGTIFGLQLSCTFPSDADFEGLIVWASDTSGFPLSSATKKFEGRSSVYNMVDAEVGKTYYFRVAAYDSFGKNDTGTGLNVSGQYEATAVSSAPGLPGGTAFPASPTLGQEFFRTDLGSIFRWNGTAWQRTAIKGGTTAQMNALTNNVVGDLFWNTSVSPARFYAWNGSSWVAQQIPANAIFGQLTAGQIDTYSLATDYAFINNARVGILEGFTVNANTVNSSTSNTLTAFVNQLNMVSSSTPSMLRTQNKTYADGQWGFIMGATVNNGSNYVNFKNGVSELRMHSNGEFLLESSGFRLTNNSLTITTLNVIGTSNIQGGAVSSMAFSSAGNQVNVPANSISWSGQLYFYNYDTQGYPIYFGIMCDSTSVTSENQGEAFSYSTVSKDVAVQIFRDGSQIFSDFTNGFLEWVYTPPAGPATYTIQFLPTGRSYNGARTFPGGSITYRSGKLMGFKR
ncbi:host specificity protein J [Acidovorax sp. M14]|uniref:host specificity protein J n=1 Tax=Acidovorax sp. M14 TaxID=3411354 RepID=UPI003BF5BCA7